MVIDSAAELPGAFAAAEEVESALSVEAIPETVRVAIREMPIYLPKEPIQINGQAFGFELHDERLAAAVNRADKVSPNDWHPVRSLTLVLGESLPAQLARESVSDQIYDNKKDGLELSVPEVVTDPHSSIEDLRASVEDLINEQIKTGLLQSIAMSRYTAKALRFIRNMAFSVAPSAGVAMGFASEHFAKNTSGQVAYGGGTALGVFVGSIGIIITHNRLFDEKVRRWARERAGENDPIWEDEEVDERAFSEPLITLVPIEKDV